VTDKKAKQREAALRNLALTPRTGRLNGTAGLIQTDNEAKVDTRLHQRGYQLWRAGLNATEIRKRLHVSKSTWKWLLQIGSPRLHAYEDLLIDEVASIRNSASKIAVELSETSVTVLRDRMTAAGKANQIINVVLDRVLSAGQMEEADPAMLKALAQIANVTPVAEAYQKIYGGSAALRGLYPTMDHAKAEYKPALEAVQGGDATNADAILPAEKRDEIVQDMGGWTEEEIEVFAKTGVEPAPGRP
jgi:hypothetical protein